MQDPTTGTTPTLANIGQENALATPLSRKRELKNCDKIDSSLRKTLKQQVTDRTPQTSF
jgi:hypothetical protein